MSGLTPAPTKRVHDPSRVATHGVALASAGQSAFRSERVVMALLVPCLAADPRFAVTVPSHGVRRSRGSALPMPEASDLLGNGQCRVRGVPPPPPVRRAMHRLTTSAI